MPAPKFNFISERLVGGDSRGNVFEVTVTKQGMLRFSPFTSRTYDLDGKFMCIYADVDKKCIAWKIVEDETSLAELGQARKLKKNPISDSIIVSIKKLLKRLGVETKETTRYKVEEYGSSLLEGKLFYIELNK